MAQHTRARITLLQVVVPTPAYVYEALPGATLGGFVDPRWDDVAREGAQVYVDRLAERLRTGGIEAVGRASIAVGTTVPEMIAQAADAASADLVVMSTHTMDAPLRSLLGSVAEKVLEQAHRPVLLVRREALAHRAGRTEALARAAAR